jgi:hypothetical protein
MKTANSKASSNNLSIFDISACIAKLKAMNSIPDSTDLKIIKYDMNNVLDTSTSNEIRNNLSVIFQIINPINNKQFDLTQCNSSQNMIGIPVLFPSGNNLRFLQTLKFTIKPDYYTKMLAAGIDIYNPSDPKYFDRCSSVIDPNNNADTSLNYRIKNYFQGVTITCTSGCSYSGIDATNNVICNCNGVPTNAHLQLQQQTLSTVSDLNLSIFNCNNVAFGSTIGSNPAFWIGTLIIILLFLVTPCLYYIQYFNECQITNGYGEKLANSSQVHVVGTDDIKRRRSLTEYELSFCGYFFHIIKGDHVVLAIILYRSLAFPFWLRFVLMLTYLNLVFSFSAFLFTDDLIYNRALLDQPTRDAFFYPIAHEFGRVILTIVFTFIIYEVLRFVMKRLPPDLLVQMEAAETSGDINRAIEDIHEYNRRLRVKNICLLVLVVVIIFIGWYYMIVFNGVYTTLGKGWAFGALNAILIDLLGLRIFISFVKAVALYCYARKSQ